MKRVMVSKGTEQIVHGAEVFWQYKAEPEESGEVYKTRNSL